MKYSPSLRHGLPLAALAALLASCSTPLPPDPGPRSPAVVVTPEAAKAAEAAGVYKTSHAPTPRAYRQDAASHIYGMNSERIFKGRLPPMLYAIGVVNVEVDRQGQVQKIDWMRKPNHAPEVIAEIERTVRAAQPFPVPARMGKVVYTDTWLWHKSGRFQLDTLTEGQD
jgi:protein TonB